MKMKFHFYERTKYDDLSSYPQATRGECSNCSFVLRSNQHG
jgi:hypothetical protein